MGKNRKAVVLLAVLLVCSLCFSGCGNLRRPAKQDNVQFQIPASSAAADYGNSNASPTEETCPYVPVGSYYTFGTYPQTHSSDPIEWIVLECSEGNALLVSRYALDSVEFHSRAEDVNWESSSVRQWLNTMFYSAAFNDAEQNMIWESYCPAERNPLYQEVDPGRDTYDHVFLLSAKEAQYYFPTDRDRICKPTEYAFDQGAYMASDTGGAWWWLRTPGDSPQDAASVNTDGSMDLDDGTVTSQKGTVRPAIWIQLPR